MNLRAVSRPLRNHHWSPTFGATQAIAGDVLVAPFPVPPIHDAALEVTISSDDSLVPHARPRYRDGGAR